MLVDTVRFFSDEQGRGRVWQIDGREESTRSVIICKIREKKNVKKRKIICYYHNSEMPIIILNIVATI